MNDFVAFNSIYEKVSSNVPGPARETIFTDAVARLLFFYLPVLRPQQARYVSN